MTDGIQRWLSCLLVYLIVILIFYSAYPILKAGDGLYAGIVILIALPIPIILYIYMGVKHEGKNENLMPDSSSNNNSQEMSTEYIKAKIMILSSAILGLLIGALIGMFSFVVEKMFESTNVIWPIAFILIFIGIVVCAYKSGKTLNYYLDKLK